MSTTPGTRGNPKHAPSVYVRMRDEGMSNYQIAAALDCDEATVRRGLRKVGYKSHLLKEDASFFQFEIEKPVVIHGDAAITSDWHFPLTDPSYVNQFIEHARSEKNRKHLIVAGDWFNFDHWSDYEGDQLDAGIEKELGASSYTAATLLETFELITMCLGNHDVRATRALKFKLRHSKAMQLMFADLGPKEMKRITFSGRNYVINENEGRIARCVHPKQYNANPLVNARKMADKYQCDMLVGHSHHCAIGVSQSGLYTACELGGFHWDEVTDYNQDTTTFSKWTQGYAFNRKGKIQLNSPLWSTV